MVSTAKQLPVLLNLQITLQIYMIMVCLISVLVLLLSKNSKRTVTHKLLAIHYIIHIFLLYIGRYMHFYKSKIFEKFYINKNTSAWCYYLLIVTYILFLSKNAARPRCLPPNAAARSTPCPLHTAAHPSPPLVPEIFYIYYPRP